MDSMPDGSIVKRIKKDSPPIKKTVPEYKKDRSKCYDLF